MKTRYAKVFSNLSADTYKEFLKECIEKTDGDILEIGCSQHSTGFILDCIENTNKTLTSLTGIVGDYRLISLMFPKADNHIWLSNFENWDDLFSYVLQSGTKYSVIFIDSYPWVTRRKALNRLYSICEYMVIHDAKLLIEGKFIEPYKYFENLELCLPMKPYPEGDIYNSTLICSIPKIQEKI